MNDRQSGCGRGLLDATGGLATRAAVLTAAVVLVVGQLFADWPQWRGPDRTGYAISPAMIESLPADGLAASWVLDGVEGGNSGGWSSPVVSQSRVYIYAHTKTKNGDVEPGESKYPWLPPEKRTGMTDEEYEAYEVKRRDENERQSKAFRFDERIVCVDLESGDVVWDRSVDSVYTRFVQSGTPCVAESGDGKTRVLVLGAERTARCWDGRTGEMLWQTRLPGDFRDEYFASSFVTAQNVAMVACGPLVAIDINDGKVLWKGDAPMDYGSHSSPAVWTDASGEAIAIANTTGGMTQGYRVADGTKLWEFDGGASQSSPIVVGDQLLVYGSSRKSGLTAWQLSPAAPETLPVERWQFNGAADSGSTPVVAGASVLVQGDKRLAKVNLADGDRSWQTTMNMSNPRYTSLVAAGDQAFFGWDGVLAFRVQGDSFEKLYDAKIDSDRMLIGADDLRAKLKLDAIRGEPGGAEEAEKVWQESAIRSGPLACATPALSDGRMIVRLRDAVVCYDLRLKP